MSYRKAGIDVHKEMLAVVIADVGVIGTYQFQRRKFGAQPLVRRDYTQVSRLGHCPSTLQAGLTDPASRCAV
jgi:hypothetical protein